MASVATAHHLQLSGDGDIDTAHQLLVGVIEMRPKPYDAARDTMVEAHTLGSRPSIPAASMPCLPRLGWTVTSTNLPADAEWTQARFPATRNPVSPECVTSAPARAPAMAAAPRVLVRELQETAHQPFPRCDRVLPQPPRGLLSLPAPQHRLEHDVLRPELEHTGHQLQVRSTRKISPSHPTPETPETATA